MTFDHSAESLLGVTCSVHYWYFDNNSVRNFLTKLYAIMYHSQSDVIGKVNRVWLGIDVWVILLSSMGKVTPPWNALKQYVVNEIQSLCVLILGTRFKEWTTSYLAFVSISGQKYTDKSSPRSSMNTSTAVFVSGWGRYKNYSPTEYYTSDPPTFRSHITGGNTVT